MFGINRDAGISNGALATLLIGTVNVLATGLGVYLMERTGTRRRTVPGTMPHARSRSASASMLRVPAGRRPLIVYGAFTMLIASLGLTVMLALNVRDGTMAAEAVVWLSLPALTGVSLESGSLQKYHEGNAATGVFAVIFIMVFVTGFEVGLGPIPWAIGTEVFSEDARATAMGT